MVPQHVASFFDFVVQSVSLTVSRIWLFGLKNKHSHTHTHTHSHNSSNAMARVAWRHGPTHTHTHTHHSALLQRHGPSGITPRAYTHTHTPVSTLLQRHGPSGTTPRAYTHLQSLPKHGRPQGRRNNCCTRTAWQMLCLALCWLACEKKIIP